MPIVFGVIAPHARRLLPEFKTKPDEMPLTSQALQRIGTRLENHKPDTIIILTPHGIRVEGAISISVSENASGSLGAKVSTRFKVDQLLARAISNNALSCGIPIAKCTYGASSGFSSSLPLDWGAIVPLRLLEKFFDPQSQVIVVCPSRLLPRQQLFDFGRGIASITSQSPKRVVLIASADQAHTHHASGPYGFSESASEFDHLIVELVCQDKLERLLDVDINLIKKAIPDSYWQMLILAGAMQIQPLCGEFLSYEVSSYFGMLCALYE
jgi:aromatic ring-opening dioxygenase LigB subunit